MSVADLSKIDPRTLIGKGRVGLLDSTGTYDVDRYAWAYEFWKRQQQTHWMGEEVPLGSDLKDWAAVRAGLQKSENVIGNGVVPDILQNTNPARPDEIRKFAASYRGFLKIDKPGVYRFFANADEAVRRGLTMAAAAIWTK